MPAKVTRVELVIIIAALLVLLLCNRTPKPGSADIRADVGQTAQDVQDAIAPVVSTDNLPPLDEVQAATVSMIGVGMQPPADTVPDNPKVEPVPPAQPKPKRYGIVDARKSGLPKYKNLMYGEITVRRVWDGTRFVFRQVCEVKEPSGAISVWSFEEQHEGITLSELPPGELPPTW